MSIVDTITTSQLESFITERAVDRELENSSTKIIEVVKDGVVVDSLELPIKLANILLQQPTFVDVTSNPKFDFARQPLD